MSALGRQLPPPSRRVQPTRKSRFATLYRAPPSSSDDDTGLPSRPATTSLGKRRPVATSTNTPSARQQIARVSPPKPRAQGLTSTHVGVVATGPGRKDDGGGLASSAPAAFQHSSSPPRLVPILPPAASTAGRQRSTSSSSLSSAGSSPPAIGHQSRRRGSNSARGGANSQTPGPVRATSSSTTNNVTAKAGSKVYQCSGFGECSMIFTRSEHLARHIRKHTGQKPFACHCTKAFSRVDNLRQHCATVHPTSRALNESTIAALRQQHTALSTSAVPDLQKYLKKADETLGIAVRHTSVPPKPAAAPGVPPVTRSSDNDRFPQQQQQQQQQLAAAGLSAATSARKRSGSTFEDSRTSGTKAPPTKKARRKRGAERSASLTSSSTAVGSAEGRSQPAQKPSTLSRFGLGPHFSPAHTQAGPVPYQSAFSSHGMPATPAEGRETGSVRIARDSIGDDSSVGSPYPSYQQPSQPLYYNEDPVTRPRPLLRKEPLKIARPGRLLPDISSSSGDVQQFTRQHFEAMKHDDSWFSEEEGIARKDPPTMASSSRPSAATGGLLPSASLSNRSQPPPLPAPTRLSVNLQAQQPTPPALPLPLPRLPFGGPISGTQYPMYQARPARRFTLQHHAFGGGRQMPDGWAEEPYSTDFSLSSARTRLSSGVSLGPDASGTSAFGHSRAASATGSSWQVQVGAHHTRGPSRDLDLPEGSEQSSPVVPLLRLPPAAFDDGEPPPVTSHRTIHSPEKSSPARSVYAHPLNDDRHTLMDLAVEHSAQRSVPFSAPQPSERSMSPEGALWGDPALDNSPQVQRQQDQPMGMSPSATFHERVMGFGQHRYRPFQQPILRYESAFSPPPAPPPSFWGAPYPGTLSRLPPCTWAPQPLDAPLPHLRAFSAESTTAPHNLLVNQAAHNGDGPLSQSSGEGPMLSNLSPLSNSAGIVDTPPATTADDSYAPSSRAPCKRARDDDDEGQALGSGHSALRSKPATLVFDDVERIGASQEGHMFSSTFAGSLDFERQPNDASDVSSIKGNQTPGVAVDDFLPPSAGRRPVSRAPGDGQSSLAATNHCLNTPVTARSAPELTIAIPSASGCALRPTTRVSTSQLSHIADAARPMSGIAPSV